MLISLDRQKGTDSVAGRNVTAYCAVTDDLHNAGAVYHDVPALIDGNVVTGAFRTTCLNSAMPSSRRCLSRDFRQRLTRRGPDAKLSEGSDRERDLAGVAQTQSTSGDTMDISEIKAMTFDVFGTVVDWRGSIIGEGEMSGPLRALMWTGTDLQTNGEVDTDRP